MLELDPDPLFHADESQHCIRQSTFIYWRKELFSIRPDFEQTYPSRYVTVIVVNEIEQTSESNILKFFRQNGP